MSRALRELAEATGCSGFRVVRSTRHVIADFTHPDVSTPIRVTLSKSPSDHRAAKNRIRDLTNAIRVKKETTQ